MNVTKLLKDIDAALKALARVREALDGADAKPAPKAKAKARQASGAAKLRQTMAARKAKGAPKAKASGGRDWNDKARKLLAKGATQRAVAEALGVSRSAVTAMVKRDKEGQ